MDVRTLNAGASEDQEKAIRLSGAWGTSGCELPDTGAGNQTQVLPS